MLVALICRDKPGHLQVRMENRPAHLDYIRESGVVSMAGPLVESDQMCGSLIILDVPTIEAGRAWAASDPYGKVGLFQSVDVIEWKKVIG